MLTPQQKRNMLFLLIYSEYRKTQQEIATFFNVSQPTVAYGIKEAKYLFQINSYKQEIKKLRQELEEKMGLPPSNIPTIDINNNLIS